MDVIGALLFLVGWIVLNTWVLPKFGVQT